MTSEVFENGYVNVSARNERHFEILMTEWFDTFVAPSLAGVTQETRRYMMKNIFKELDPLYVGNIALKSYKGFSTEKSRQALLPTASAKRKICLIISSSMR